jgi:hypothetical protein
MATLTEGAHAGEFIVSEANVGATGVPRGRDTGTLASGQNLAAGSVLGVVSASGEYAVYNNAAADGTEVAAAILFDAVDASAGAEPCVVLNGDCEVNGSELNWNGEDQTSQDAGTADLKAIGVRVR